MTNPDTRITVIIIRPGDPVHSEVTKIDPDVSLYHQRGGRPPREPRGEQAVPLVQPDEYPRKPLWHSHCHGS